MASYDEVMLEDIVHGSIATFNPNTGVNKDADSTPTLTVYEEGSSTALTVTSSVTNITTGRYRFQVTVEASAGFEAGKFYEVWATATVTGTDTVTQSAPVLSFKVDYGVNARQIDGSATAATNLKNSSLAVRSATVVTAEAAANTATAFDTNLPLEAANYYGSTNGGLVICFISGTTNQFQTRRVVASATGTANTRITVEEAFDATPVNAEAFVILGRITELS